MDNQAERAEAARERARLATRLALAELGKLDDATLAAAVQDRPALDRVFIPRNFARVKEDLEGLADWLTKEDE